MAPTPQNEPLQSKIIEPGLNGDSIVISGMAGLFPMSENVKDLSKLLYNKVNPVTSENCRWKWNHPDVSQYSGKVPGIELFDSQFFMVHNRLGNCMDPMARKVLEQSYQAIYDAGLSPKHLNGKEVGVYIATTHSDMEKDLFNNSISKICYRLTGCSRTMFANRISYWLNIKGPSMTIDDASCGSIVALEEAFNAINSGTCEAAIVGGTNLCQLPHSQVHYNRCIAVAPGAETRSFDERANGCSISEAISVIFLQKAKHALRAYAEIVHVKNEFISKLHGETGQMIGFIRDPDDTAKFLKQFYAETSISPQAVQYIEGFGSATPEADKTELQAIEKVFCDNRIDPLLVGSVISNVGFTDAASGTMALTKVLLGYHHGTIASNINCETPRQDIAAIRDGRMVVVTKHQPFQGTYAAVNCLSVTGVNSHVLLRGCSKPKDFFRYKTTIPRLVTLSSRQEAHLKNIFMDLKSRPIDPEELALLMNIHSNNISGHLGRGYIILDTDKDQNTISLSEKTEHSDDVHRPLWFVYSGMGSQWAGMGAQLMRIPIFAAAIERCHKVLQPEGVDIVHIITSQDQSIFDNVLNSFVGIAAIQIGLTDVLIELGLHPDKIIGHSTGELGCAYADGCLTTEEMILSAYSRGVASNKTILVRGAMAAVGLGYQDLLKMCPPSIDIACHNSSNSSTISGPEKNIRDFLALLTANGVFSKEVPCANIAYHSRYIGDVGINLFRLLSKIINKPKARSERWLSTSVPQDRWDEHIAKYCSAEYLTNNLVSSVLFEETSRLIPSNAVLIEIAPHGLLQAILRRSLPKTCKNIPLTQRGHQDNALFLLEAIGKLYIEGYSPQMQAIYPKVEFPVSTGTPHLAHHVKWNHNDTWIILGLKDNVVKKTASTCKFLITAHDDEYTCLKGNVIQGNTLYPFAGALVAVWDTLMMTLGLLKKTVSVRFYDVHLYSQPILHDQRQLELYVSLHRGSGRFEVLDGDSKVATGFIVTIVESEECENIEFDENFVISSDEIYRHLSSQGYSYREQFRSIHSTDESVTNAKLFWNDNWVTLIDGLIQLNALRLDHAGVFQPNYIRDLTIDLKEHLKSIQQDGITVLKAKIDEFTDCTRCGGVIIKSLQFRSLPPLNKDIIHPKTYITSRKNVALQIDSVGNLDTLHWEEAPGLSGSGVKVLVNYAGINILDVNRATGVIPFEDDEKYYGMDFSGITENGERVMGLVRNGATRTMVSAWPELLWPVPAYWTLEEAATVPLAYIQALYCLCIRNKLQPGSKVLIHGAAGALGQAAISVALAHGCQVFATVADNAKKRFLLKLFPLLNENAIGNSRNASFGDLVLNATSGEGCKIVICCVRGNLKNISLKCTAFTGVTIDTVQIRYRDKYDYGMFYLTNDKSYIAVDFYSIFDSRKRTELSKLQTMLSDGIARGYVRPLSRVTFAPHEAPRAFRLLAASRHRGRVLLRVEDSLSPAKPRIECSSQNSHLIVWDGDLFGLLLADKLITRGARKLRIHCLKPTSKFLLKLRLWQKAGVDVKILGEKFNSNAIPEILDQTSQCGPVEGIYVSTTAFLGNTENNDLDNIINNLDAISRKLCPVLKYFAVITVDTNIGQQTYVSRSKDGFPATLLNLSECKHVVAMAEVEPSWYRTALDMAELALRHQNSILYAQQQTTEKTSLFKLVPALTDLDSNDSRTLRDLDLCDSLPCIKSFLRDVYHVSLEDEDILELTKKKILELEMGLSEHDFEDVKGLRTFFSHVYHDELRAIADLIPLSTLGHDVKSSDYEIIDSKSYLFIIPGLEGHHARFRALSKLLKLPAIVLQPGLDHPDETPQELARRYSKILLEKLKLKTNFHLLGYECGIYVVLELASILEENGLTGTVFCIGDGPEELKALLQTELSSFRSEEALQDGVVRHMVELMTNDSAASIDTELGDCCSWRTRVDACVRALQSRVSHTAQYTRALLQAAYARVCTARRYRAEPRALRSRLVLLRARRVPASTEECSLQRYSQQPLIVRDLAEPMAHATADLRVPAIINKYLDKDVLKIHEQMNICEEYNLYLV